MGVRSNVTINFGELTMYGPMNSGDWTDGSRNSEQKVAVPKLEFIDYTMKNRKLIIITAEVSYFYLIIGQNQRCVTYINLNQANIKSKKDFAA